ncbi:MAG: PHB depolymerase family esterase [Myxococcales bacterium]
MKTVRFYLALAAAVAAAGCGGSGAGSGSGGRSGSGTGGTPVTGTGGTSATGTGGSPTTGSGGSDVTGTGGSPTTGSGGSDVTGTGGTSATGTGGAPATGTGGTPTTGSGGAAGESAGGRGGNAGHGGGGSGSGGAAGGGAVTGPCMPARPHAAGNSTVMMQSSGTNRTYELHVPASYDGTKSVPLVFDVHGLGSFGTEQRQRSKWDVMADKEGFVLINPNGVNNGWSAGNGGNDGTFFRDMVKKATAELCIDSKRVYVSGHSYGGAMTIKLACESADIFAAAAPVCGWSIVNPCKPARPIAILPIRATGDTTVPYAGRSGVSSAAQDVQSWMGYNMCAATPVVMSANGVCTNHTSCAAGTQVMECHPAGNHNFFYATTNLLVPDTVWPFFKQFSLP